MNVRLLRLGKWMRCMRLGSREFDLGGKEAVYADSAGSAVDWTILGDGSIHNTATVSRRTAGYILDGLARERERDMCPWCRTPRNTASRKCPSCGDYWI